MDIPTFLEEFKKKYDGTYVLCSAGGTREVYKVKSIIREAGTNQIMVGLHNKKQGTVIVNALGLTGLEFEYPPMGMFQNGEFCAFSKKVPARQWRRGLYSANFGIFDATLSIASVAPRGNLISDTTLENAFKSFKFPVKEAANLLRKDQLGSAAVSKFFFLSLPFLGITHKKGDLFLCTEGNIVGLLGKDDKYQSLNDLYLSDVAQLGITV